MPVTAGARRPVSMWTVGPSEKIGAQCRRTTGGKAPKHPHFVFAQLEQTQQSRQESAQDGTNVFGYLNLRGLVLIGFVHATRLQMSRF
jgi:hypothetical protein